MVKMQTPTRSVSMTLSSLPKPWTHTHVMARPDPRSRRSTRTFSSSVTAPAMLQSGRMPRNISERLPSQPSMKTSMKNVARSEMPDDLGFLPQTFVYGPSTANYPTFFSEPRSRLRIEYNRSKQAVMGLFTIAYMCKWNVPRHPVTRKRITRPLLLRERGRIARELHARLYTALADGDMADVSRIVCKGLEEKSRIQIEKRKAERKPRQHFSIQKYNGWNSPSWLVWPLTLLPFQSTRVITDKITPLPIGKNGWLRQCVVRIKSTQSLDRGTGKGPESKALEEYVVIQKLAFDDEEQPWKIWGTMQPSSAEEIMQMGEERLSPVKSFFDILKQKMSSMSGGII